MLKIRLSRQGRNGRPFYRVVLTEHTQPVKAGFMEVLGRFDPLAHKMEVEVEAVKSRVSKGAQLSERIAKLLYAQTKDVVFTKFFEHRERVATTKNEKK